MGTTKSSEGNAWEQFYDALSSLDDKFDEQRGKRMQHEHDVYQQAIDILFDAVVESFDSDSNPIALRHATLAFAVEEGRKTRLKYFEHPANKVVQGRMDALNALIKNESLEVQTPTRAFEHSVAGRKKDIRIHPKLVPTWRKIVWLRFGEDSADDYEAESLEVAVGEAKYAIGTRFLAPHQWGYAEEIGAELDNADALLEAFQELTRGADATTRLIKWYQSQVPQVTNTLLIPTKLFDSNALFILGFANSLSKDIVFLLNIIILHLVHYAEYNIDNFHRLEATRRAAVASVMARNMSHNVGSHVLASPELLRGSLDQRIDHALKELPSSPSKKDKKKVSNALEAGRKEVQALHNYLQQRMDFIAQVVSYTPSWGEPMFFFEDLLRGFARQKLLLGFLVKDQGYTGDKISFTVHHDGKTRTLSMNGKAKTEREDENEPPSESGTLEDFLVAIPGGTIGAHAFYDILENVMRNSAKYGESEDVLEVHLDISRDEDRYCVTLWDNLSPQEVQGSNGKDRVGAVSKHLVEPLVDPRTGNTETEGRGLHEIKECARILAHPYGKDADWHFEVESNGEVSDLPIASIAHPDQQGVQHLAYQFYLQNPHLVGVAYPEGGIHGSDAEDEEARRAGLFSYAGEENGLSALASLTEYAHQFGIVWMPENDEGRKEVLNFIAENHHLLPYRLLLATSHQEQEMLEEAVAAQGGIPARRVHFCKKRKLASILEKEPESSWGRVVLKIYELWLKQFKPSKSGKWEVAILLDREEGSAAFESWKQGLDEFNSDVVNVHVGRFDGKERIFHEVEYSTSDLDNQERLAEAIAKSPQNFVVFDNHGLGFRSIGEGTNHAPNDQRSELACYHEAGLKEALRLYQSLESPPHDAFGLTYFVLGLVESALTNVLVVDERLAEATFTKEHGLATPYHLLPALRKAGTYPIYSLWTGEDEDSCTRTFVSDAVKETHDTVVKKEGEDFGIHPEEGLHLCRASSSFVKRQDAEGDRSFLVKIDNWNRDTNTGRSKRESIDTIVVHQGVLDRLVNFSPPRWHRHEDLKALFQLSPSVIVTSGRGRNLREKTTPSTMPFIEFSTVRETTYADTSKYHFVRALLSVVGKRD